MTEENIQKKRQRRERESGILIGKIFLIIGIICAILLGVSLAYEIPYYRAYEKALYDPFTPNVLPAAEIAARARHVAGLSR